MTETADPGGPWVHISGISGVDGLHLELEKRDGRLVVVGLYVHGPEITPGVLREVPLARLNTLFLPSLDADPVPSPPGMSFMVANRVTDPTVGELRASIDTIRERINEIEVRSADKWRRDVARLGELRSSGLTDDFYLELAWVYRQAAAQTRAPAKKIADEMGIPVGTVHRWVREARLAGKLPPARKGAAG